MRNKLFVCATTATLAAMMFGCNGAPTTTTQAPVDEMAMPIQQPAAPMFSVQAVGPEVSFDQILAQIPKQISDSDAQRMLVTIDPSIVKDDEPTTYSVQQRGRGHGHGGMRGGMRGGSFHGAFGHRGGFRNFNRFRFFRHNNFYFPYYRRFNTFYPYYYNNTYPYLYNYNNTCYPYTYNRLVY